MNVDNIVLDEVHKYIGQFPSQLGWSQIVVIDLPLIMPEESHFKIFNWLHYIIVLFVKCQVKKLS